MHGTTNRLITFKHSKYILKVRLCEVQFPIITPDNSFMSYSMLLAVLNFIQGMAVNKSVSNLHYVNYDISPSEKGRAISIPLW